MSKETKRVKWLDCNQLQVNILAVRFAKTKALVSIDTPSGIFTITTTKNSGRRLMRA